MTELHELDAHDLAATIARGDVSCVEVTRHFLERVEADELGAFVTVTSDRALTRAAELDAMTDRPAFAGVPTAFKDLTMTAGVPTSMGSRLMAGRVPDHNAHVVDLVEAAGFVSLGKSNTPEFGLSSYTDNDVVGPACCPADPRLNAGGSSGGAAAAVGSHLLPWAPGSDGGGSIRIPASCCGVIGFKPSRGRIGAGPDSPTWSGLATDGVLARSVRDVAAVLDLLARPVPGSSRVWPAPATPFAEAATRDPGRLRIATWTDPYLDFATASPGSVAAVEAARDSLAALGHEIVEVANPWPAELEQQFNVVWSAGMASVPLPDEAIAQLRPTTRYWHERGGRASAPQLAAAMTYLELTTAAVNASLADVDLFLTPTLALPPQPHAWFTESGDPAEDHRRELLFTPYTALMNMSGQPAVSVPGHVHEGLPVGVMLAGHVGADALVLQVADQLVSRARS
ncbi:amidase [Aeromicrobium duanguangcaii]|uniref:Amidase n=1 Tax=Aeromicrobium duanguangcaii TaxID=2968086 RepID=A0ABY5KEU0_9ACTN|nr:amidase [Aeromicrobium duanguangcaii]MCD9155431.1 amidase [Aeromicrobium duanguangcaii]UUI68298.1 amidase [Aeromicrobium duanguangcaii]